MRAVKNNLPTPSGEVGESEGPRWTRAVEDQSAPIPEEITSELGRSMYIVRHAQSRIDQAILKGASGRKTRALMTVVVRQPRSLPSFGYQEMAEGARFETPNGTKTMGPDLTVSVLSQSFTKARGRGKTDQTRSGTMVPLQLSYIASRTVDNSRMDLYGFLGSGSHRTTTD